ncbi:hypothetical protein FCV25MIE_31785 [Fagus crenata]
MIRTRLLWLGVGFSVTGAMKKFDALEGRVSNLESIPYPKSNPGQENNKCHQPQSVEEDP